MFTLTQINEIISGVWLQQRRPETLIRRLLLDSRQIGHAEGGLFFALVGERHNGHRFLDDAYRAGARHFVVSEPPDPARYPDADILQAPDTLKALQHLAAQHRSRFRYPVVGITGSNGKTIVKEWLYQLLHPDQDIIRSPRSYNSQVGVPLSVWQMSARHQLAIIEAGISRKGEMARLGAIIRPDIGVFTNIGPAHREGFSSDEEKVAEKMRLFDAAHTLIYCADHPLIHAAARAWAAAAPGRSLLSWTRRGQDAQLRFQVGSPTAQGVPVQLFRGEDAAARMPEAYFVLPFADEASVENALHCCVLLRLWKLDASVIAERLLRLEPVAMRLELKAGINRCLLLNDAYSNDLASLRIALQFANRQASGKPVIAVLSDILQSGEQPDNLYRQVADILKEHAVGTLIGIGSDIPRIRSFLPDALSAHFYENTDAFLQSVEQHGWSDALILLKGARIFRFEQIAARFEAKAHKTVLEVNLNALIHNLQAYHRLLKPGVKMLVMVKAAGYGAGPAEIARLLEFHKIDYLGVAYTDEGIELRQAGVQLPILVLNPEPSGYDALYRYRLEPEIYNQAGLDALIAYVGEEKRLRIHLKLDTGMHRLGFVENELPELLDALAACPNLEVATVFSHLAGSDSNLLDQFTREQAATFERMYRVLTAGLGYTPDRHLANTGAIVRFPEYHYEMVRLGIGIYGVDTGGMQRQLQPVHTLKATISQIKSLQPGETVGYNRNGCVERSSRIATISIGYADGLLRLAGNGRYQVALRSRRAPTIGNICMDMTMIDVTDIPEAREGDEVIIFGADPPVQELARCLQTIPYEVFTNISERVKRVYWQE